jgi:hypothetical protein
MSKASYDAEPSAEDAGMLLEHTRIRMNFAIMAKGNCQPEVTIETILPPFPDDDALVRLTLLNAKALTIATFLGRRWEWQYAHVSPPEPDVNSDPTRIATQEEIEGWLISRAPETT